MHALALKFASTKVTLDEQLASTFTERKRLPLRLVGADEKTVVLAVGNARGARGARGA
jgi:hypothetical protein